MTDRLAKDVGLAGRSRERGQKLLYLRAFEEHESQGVHVHCLMAAPSGYPQLTAQQVVARWADGQGRPYGLTKVEPFDTTRNLQALRYLLKCLVAGQGGLDWIVSDALAWPKRPTPPVRQPRS